MKYCFIMVMLSPLVMHSIEMIVDFILLNVGEYLYCSSKGDTSGTKILIKLSSKIKARCFSKPTEKIEPEFLYYFCWTGLMLLF
jgi:hypothetical protein